MKIDYKIWFDTDEGDKFFGKGNYLLLREIKTTNSLNKAAKNLNMSYSKAFNIIKNSEKSLGTSLIKSEVGGANGGGSHLTKAGERLLDLFEEADQKIQELTANLSQELNRKV
ncbi:MAG: LysR family transcriptional regulator [Finegoldia sp.]|nr:LysR family transcriptional regulator [Finegoldia sp.]